MAALTIPDQITGQDLTYAIIVGNQNIPLDDVISFRATYTDPARVVSSNNGRKRFQTTDTDTVDWTASQWTIDRQTFADVMGLRSDPSRNYGNYAFKRMLFDIAVSYLLPDAQGNIVRTGGYRIHIARFVTMEINQGDPYAILMTNLSGTAFAMWEA